MKELLPGAKSKTESIEQELRDVHRLGLTIARNSPYEFEDDFLGNVNSRKRRAIGEIVRHFQ
jgi:hypothetical protein